MPLARDVVVKGEQLLLEGDLFSFNRLIEQHIPVLDHKRYMEKMEALLDTEKMEVLIKSWHELCEHYEGTGAVVLSALVGTAAKFILWGVLIGGAAAGYISFIMHLV